MSPDPPQLGTLIGSLRSRKMEVHPAVAGDWASRGGGYCKWTGLMNWLIDWEFAGLRIRSTSTVFVTRGLILQPGLTYTEAAYGAIEVADYGKTKRLQTQDLESFPLLPMLPT